MALTPEQQKARALKMLEMRLLEGKTAEEIGAAMGLKKSTVYKAMSLARKAEIVVQFEDRLYNELLPLAHSAVLGALADGNAKIGLAVLQGTQVLRPNQQRSANAVAEDDELARYINRKRAHAALEEQTHDAELIPPQGALAASPSIAPGPAGQCALDPLPSAGSPAPSAPGTAQNGPASPQIPGPDTGAGGESGS